MEKEAPRHIGYKKIDILAKGIYKVEGIKEDDAT